MEGLHQHFESRADRAPGAVAAVDEHRELTYAALDGAANGLARQLASLGVGPGDRVGVCVHPAVEVATGLLGVLKAGAACVPLDPTHPPDRLDYMMRDASVRAVVVDGAVELTAPAGVEVVHLGASSPVSADRLDLPVSPAQPAYVIYTSGSTGQPKGVLLSHGGLSNHLAAAIDLYGLGPGDVVLQLSSIGFDISVEEMFPTWGAGGRVVFRGRDAPLSGSAFLTALSAQGVTVLDLPTAFWHQWMRDLDLLDGHLPDTLRAVIVGGERANRHAFEVWQRVSGGRVRWFNTYGPTEASVIVTAWEAAGGPVGDELPLGWPIGGAELRVVDDAGVEVADGHTGELLVGGVGVAIGYLNRPELDRERFVPDPGRPGMRRYRTGDLVARGPGGVLEFRGRVDDQVKIRGFRVEPGEVEAAIAALPGVAQAVVVARPAASGEARLLAYVLAEPGADLDASEILRVLPERLPLPLVPAAAVLVDGFVLTANGKIDKRALPEVEQAHRRLPTRAVEARDPLDRALVDLWREVLEIDEVGIDDDFFALGGHSLAAVRLLGMIEWLMGADVPLHLLLERPTVAHLADRIRSGELQGSGSLLQPVASGGELPPLLYVCTVETGVVALRHVLPLLPAGQPVHAYVLRRTKDLAEASTSIETLAEAGVQALLDEVPADAYRLLGYSFGGLVAYEMAQRLVAAGRRVEILGLLDTWSPQVEGGGGVATEATRTLRRVDLAKGAARRLVGRALRPGSPTPDGGVAPSDPQATRLLLDDGTLARMYAAYCPEPYRGRLLLLATDTTARDHGGAWLGWHQPAGADWRQATVEGEHGSVMRADNAPAVGRALADALGQIPVSS